MLNVFCRKQVDLGLSEVDRKLMAMYQRLPEVHRRQLQVYRKQMKLSTVRKTHSVPVKNWVLAFIVETRKVIMAYWQVCMQLVGGEAPDPPPPGSPPPAPHHLPCRALCPEYHLQRFKEVCLYETSALLLGYDCTRLLKLEVQCTWYDWVASSIFF